MPRLRFESVATLVVLVFLATAISIGQAPPVVGGLPAFSTFDANSIAAVNLSNLNVHLDIPLRSLPGRGIPFNSHLVLDTVWGAPTVYPPTYGTTVFWGGNGTRDPIGAPNAGNFTALGFTGGYVFSNSAQQQCVNGQTNYGNFTVYSNFTYIDNQGTTHYFPSNLQIGSNIQGQTYQCPYFQSVPNTAAAYPATDGSPYQIHLSPGANAGLSYVLNIATGVTNDKTDADGNSNNYSTNTLIDSSGNAAMSVTGTSNSVTYSYTGPDGLANDKHIVATLTTLTPTINIGCPNVQDPPYSFLPGYPYPALALTGLTLADETSSYSFTYDSLLRPLVVTLPTGGQITFNYNGAHKGISCEDGGGSGFTETTPDGTWTYSRVYNQTTQLWTTTVTDPQGNMSAYTFGGSSFYSYSLKAAAITSQYETQRLQYQKVGANQVLMKTVVTCYNGNFTNCATDPTPTKNTAPFQKDVYTYLPGISAPSVSETTFNNGVVTQDTEYDFGGAAALPNPPGGNFISRRTVTLGTYTCTQSDVTTNSAGTVLAKTTRVCNAQGHPTSESRLIQGSTYATTGYTYYSTGLVKTTTNPNNTVTTYTNNACNGSFPTSIAVGSLTTTLIWDCNGEVITNVTDANNQPIGYGYIDPLWRLTSVVDPLQNTTSFSYSPTTVRGAMNFNGTISTSEMLTMVDGLGRQIVAQTRKAPGSANYDSIQTGYGWISSGACTAQPPVTNVRCTLQTEPYVGTSGQPAPGGTAVTTTQYDALSRPVSVTDGGRGTVSYSYAKNDVLVTNGPAPSGENTKRRQLEYDAVGRLTSICELTTGNGAVTCGQGTAQTGYWTRYKYDAAGRLIGVCQYTTQPLTVDCVQSPSAGQQTRTYTYDGLGRLTSEMNPEWGPGTVTYTYDVDTSGTCNGPSNGDLVKRVDSAGNVTCYQYDGLHRITWVNYPSGPNAANSHARFFVYDSPFIHNTSLTANLAGRLSTAGTCTTSTCSVTTNSMTHSEFAYDPDGRMTDVWEQTPSFSAVNHATKAYWPSGIVHSLSGVPGLPTIYYGAIDGSGLDGEGRVTQVTAASGPNPSCSAPPCVSYNLAGQVTNLVFGSGDGDSYTYDPNTGRMTQYQFTINGQSLVGKLGWNANGTLGSLSITDPFNSSGNQNCTYSYDDLARLAGVSCGSAWAQTFTYDPFGNITKNGSLSWQPGYYSATNHYQLAGTSYDSNGNVVNDTFHNYQYDVDGNITAVDVGGSNYTDYLTYNALGSMVEYKQTYANGNPTWLAQQVYGDSARSHKPLGKNILSGGTVYELPLPAGAEMMAWSSAPVYGHADWLGSIRLNSTTGRTVNSDVAFAPFGEVYNSPTRFWYEFAGLNNNLTDNVWDCLASAGNGEDVHPLR